MRKGAEFLRSSFPTKACLILTFEENYDSVFCKKNESNAKYVPKFMLSSRFSALPPENVERVGGSNG
jgi:hypothetical protein